MLSFAQVATILVGIVTSALWARYLPQETYGKYQLLISFYSMLGVFCLSGMGTSLQISAAKGFDGNLFKITRLKFLASLIGALAFAGIGIYYWESDRMLAIGAFVSAGFFPFRQLEAIWYPWINGKGRLGLVAKIRILFLLPSVITITIVVVGGFISLPEVIVISQGILVVFIVGVVIYTFRSQRENQKEDKPTIHYGFHVTGAALLGWLIATDKFIINEYLSAVDVAVYSVALIFPNQIRTLYSIFNQMILPNITRANSVREAWDYLRKRFFLLYIVFALIGIAGFFMFPIIIPLLFSEKYVAAVPYAKWLWLSLCINAPATYLANILRAQKKIKFVYFFEILHPITSIVLYVILIPWGIWGIVIAKIISNIYAWFVFVGSFIFYLRKELKHCG